MARKKATEQSEPTHEEVQPVVLKELVCPKCLKTVLKSDTKMLVDGEGIERYTVQITLGVHPHALRYGIESMDSFFGERHICTACEFEFYTKNTEED